MKICPKCKQHVILDDVSNSYYCETCNVLYSEEDLDVKRQVSISFMSFILWIPILNILLLPLLKNRPDDEQSVYMNVALASMLNHLCIIVVVTLLVVNYRDNVTMNFIKEARQSSEESLIVNEVYNKLKTLPEQPSLPEIHEPEETRTLSDAYPEELVEFLSGSKISGEKVRDVMSTYSNYGYLIQTLSAKQKFTKATLYFNYGRELSQCSESEGKGYMYYEGPLQDTYFSFRGNKFTDIDIEDNRTIFYIYDTEYFLVQILYNSQNEVIGMAFIEQEDLM